MTNLERFRALTDKEVATFMMAANDCELYIPFCQNKAECQDALDGGIIENERCKECMMDWLNKPMEDTQWENSWMPTP